VVRRKFQPDLTPGSTGLARALFHHSLTGSSRSRPPWKPRSTCHGPTAKRKAQSRNSSS
jgi:hypothetical protein